MEDAIVVLLVAGAVAYVARMVWRKARQGGCGCADGGCGCGCGTPAQRPPADAPGPCACCGQAAQPKGQGGPTGSA